MSRASTSFSSAPVRISATPGGHGRHPVLLAQRAGVQRRPGSQRQGTHDGAARLRGGGPAVPSPASGWPTSGSQPGSVAGGPAVRSAAAASVPPRSQRSSAARAPASVRSPSSNVNWVSQAGRPGRRRRFRGQSAATRARRPWRTRRSRRPPGRCRATRRGRSMSASRTRCRHQMSASRKRSGPVAVKRAISPKPTRPASRRVQQRTSSRTRNDGSPPGDDSAIQGDCQGSERARHVRQHYSAVPEAARYTECRDGTLAHARRDAQLRAWFVGLPNI